MKNKVCRHKDVENLYLVYDKMSSKFIITNNKSIALANYFLINAVDGNRFSCLLNEQINNTVTDFNNNKKYLISEFEIKEIGVN